MLVSQLLLLSVFGHIKQKLTIASEPWASSDVGNRTSLMINWVIFPPTTRGLLLFDSIGDQVTWSYQPRDCSYCLFAIARAFVHSVSVESRWRVLVVALWEVLTGSGASRTEGKDMSAQWETSRAQRKWLSSGTMERPQTIAVLGCTILECSIVLRQVRNE